MRIFHAIMLTVSVIVALVLLARFCSVIVSVHEGIVSRQKTDEAEPSLFPLIREAMLLQLGLIAAIVGAIVFGVLLRRTSRRRKTPVPEKSFDARVPL